MNLCLKLGVETMEAIILIILGGRHCKTAIGLVLNKTEKPFSLQDDSKTDKTGMN